MPDHGTKPPLSASKGAEEAVFHEKVVPVLTLYACACLLAACAASGGTAGETDVLPQEEPAGDTVVCRVISVLEGGTLILAEEDSDTVPLYRDPGG